MGNYQISHSLNVWKLTLWTIRINFWPWQTFLKTPLKVLENWFCSQNQKKQGEYPINFVQVKRCRCFGGKLEWLLEH